MGTPLLSLGELDHYTLIVKDARAVSDFHVEVLGFRPMRIQRVNAGSAPPGEHDMLNHVLWLPGSSDRVLVVTEGLTEGSIFRRYLETYGSGVHHVAYAVDDLDAALATLRARGVGTTSDQILRDPVSGLRQIFLNREHCGYFLELIERGDQTGAGDFVEDNMAALANTMHQYLEAAPPTAGVADPEILVRQPVSVVRTFLAQPLNLPRWTGHRMIRMEGDRVVEARLHGDLTLCTEADETGVDFTWSKEGASRTVRVRLDPVREGTRVSVGLGAVPEAARPRIAPVISAELRVLAALLEDEPERTTPADQAQIAAWHLELHQRPGL